jgi:hypothetical protein
VSKPRDFDFLLDLRVLIAFIGVVSSSAQAKPAFQLDPSGKWVVLLSGLYNDSTCNVREFRGVVIKRQFEEDRVSIAGLILELPDGSRHFINVDVDHTGLTLNASGWIIRGLETLLTQGRVVDVSVKSCRFENAEHCLFPVSCRNCSPNAPFAKLKMLTAEQPRSLFRTSRKLKWC